MSDNDHTPGLRRTPFGFALALLGLFLPAVMVTSCGDIAAEANVTDLARGAEISLQTDEARGAVGASSLDIAVEPWAIVLILLVLMGVVVVVWGRNLRWVASPIAVVGVVAWFLMMRATTLEFEAALGDDAFVEPAGGSFVVLVGLWVAVAQSIVGLLDDAVGTPVVAVNAVFALPVLIAGASGLGTPSEGLFDLGWEPGTGMAAAASILNVVGYGLITLNRWVRAKRAGPR